MSSTLLPPLLRSLVRSPGSTSAAVLVLALGVGLTTAMLSIVSGFLMQDLPFDESHELVHLELASPDGGRGVPVDRFVDWRVGQRPFRDLAAFSFVGLSVSDGTLAQRYPGARLSANALGLLGVAPALGRGFVDADAAPGAPPVILLGDSIWRNHFEADPSLVGDSVLVEGVPTTVIGVLPAGLQFPLREDAWIPLQTEHDPASGSPPPEVHVFGRLRTETSIARATAEMNGLRERLAEDGRTKDTVERVEVVPYAQEFLGGGSRDVTLWIGLGAGLLVLAIACANVANLMLARAEARRLPDRRARPRARDDLRRADQERLGTLPARRKVAGVPQPQRRR